ncbi:hypothetical protein [Apilactobacillus kunkeei]|nr:hypothetical protein [Apilactobacillus kunkeei]
MAKKKPSDSKASQAGKDLSNSSLSKKKRSEAGKTLSKMRRNPK